MRIKAAFLVFGCLFYSNLCLAEMSDETALSFMDLARQNITKAKLSDGSFILQEKPEEKSKPIIPVSEAKRVIDFASASGVGQWCKVDWQSRYLSFMQHERAKKVWSDKQIAYIGLLHGASSEVFRREAVKRGECSKKQAEHITKILKASEN